MGAPELPRHVHQPRRRGRHQRRLRRGDSAGRQDGPGEAHLREEHIRPRRARRDPCRRRSQQSSQLRVEARQRLLHPHQRLAPAHERQRLGACPLRRGHHCPHHHEPLPQRGLRLQQPLRPRRPHRQPEAVPRRGQDVDGHDRTHQRLGDQLRARHRDIHDVLLERAGSRGSAHQVRARRPDSDRPRLAVPRRHLQEGAPARSGRTRHHHQGRGLFAALAVPRQPPRRHGTRRLEARLARRASERLVPPALQRRRDSRALPRLPLGKPEVLLLTRRGDGGRDRRGREAGRRADRVRG